MIRLSSLRPLLLILLCIVALPRAAAADYPPGDPSEMVAFGHAGAAG